MSSFIVPYHYRISYFTGKKHSRRSKDYYLQKILERNPKFIAESVYADRLKSQAQSVLKQYALGRLINIPLLKIPTAQPIVRDANDWKARFETVKSTFSSRVGQISNAALNRSTHATFVTYAYT